MVDHYEGYWQLPHDLHSAILRQPGLNGESLRVYMALGALTLGYSKSADTVGAGQIGGFCGVDRRNVHRALLELERKGLVGKERLGPRSVKRWIILPPGSVAADTRGSVNGSVGKDTRGSVNAGGVEDTPQDTNTEDSKRTGGVAGMNGKQEHNRFVRPVAQRRRNVYDHSQYA